jgi:hypothetical protein
VSGSRPEHANLDFDGFWRFVAERTDVQVDVTEQRPPAVLMSR